MTSAGPADVALGAAPSPRIAALEGLRGWLAWTVVLAHLVQITGLDRTAPHLWITQFLAREAVSVFIIISGFVICELVLTRRETWRHFITRRAFRIFPIYLLLLPFGFATMHLAGAALEHMSWAADPAFRYDDTARRTITSVEAAPAAHIVPHLFLLQGLVPDSLIDQAQTSFLGPAWSLSLEWQFYLLAPALIWALQRQRAALVAIILCILSFVLYAAGAFGVFGLPSPLPASIHYFLIGITTRLVWPHLGAAPIALAATLLACALLALAFRPMLAVLVWIAIMALIASAGRPLAEADAAARRIGRVLLEAPLALRMGAYSYAIYLAHWPILQGAAYLILPLSAFSQTQALAALSAAVIPTTFLAAHVLHVVIERPMIRLGGRLATQWDRRRARAALAS